MKKQPRHFLIFKIIGIVGIIVAVIGFINLVTGFGDFTTNNFFVGMFMFPVGSFIGLSCLMLGFRPELSKLSVKTAKYLQEENKEVLKDMAVTSAEITSEAVSITANAIKEGIKDEVFCKYCGEKIDADSKFCKHCGKNIL